MLIFITSSIGLSCLKRLILGKRSATPDLCLLLKSTESKAISTTNFFSTSLTGPYLLMVLFLTNLSKISNSSLLKPNYALQIGTILFLSQRPKVKSE